MKKIQNHFNRVSAHFNDCKWAYAVAVTYATMVVFAMKEAFPTTIWIWQR